MVSVQDKLKRPQVVLSSLKDFKQSIELLIISRVVKGWTLQFLREEGYGLSFLHEHSSYSYPWGITLHFKWFGEIG